MTNEFDTGVEESQVAAETGMETEINDETTQPLFEAEEPEDISFAEYFDDDETEKVVNSGDDNPPDKSDVEEQKQAKDQAVSGVETSKAFAIRLRDEVQKARREIAAEYDTKYAPAKEAQLELDAIKLMEKNPDMNMTLDVAKMLLKSQQPVPQVQQETSVTPEDEKQQKFDAWEKSLTDEEPMLKLETGDPAFTVKGFAQKNPVFRAALSQGITPFAAYRIVKAAEAQMKEKETAAKAEGQQEVLKKINSSNARATTPVVSAKSTGRSQSVAERINSTPIEKLNELLANGGKIYVGD